MKKKGVLRLPKMYVILTLNHIKFSFISYVSCIVGTIIRGGSMKKGQKKYFNIMLKYDQRYIGNYKKHMISMKFIYFYDFQGLFPTFIYYSYWSVRKKFFSQDLLSKIKIYYIYSNNIGIFRYTTRFSTTIFLYSYNQSYSSNCSYVVFH